MLVENPEELEARLKFWYLILDPSRVEPLSIKVLNCYHYQCNVSTKPNTVDFNIYY